ncbi:MAG: hypothetical protein ACJ72D_06820 [Marmoricola sp.]
MANASTEQRYGPTSGTLSGWAGLVLCALLVVAFSVSHFDAVSVRWILVVLAVAVLIWSMMLRPVIIVRGATVVLRNPFSSWLVPLAAIEVVAVRAVTRIEAGGQGYNAVAVGRRVRKMVGRESAGRITDLGSSGGRLSTPPEPKTNRIDASTPERLADLMTDQILAAADDARRSGQQPGPVERVWAWPELGALAALVTALVVLLLV